MSDHGEDIALLVGQTSVPVDGDTKKASKGEKNAKRHRREDAASANAEDSDESDIMDFDALDDDSDAEDEPRGDGFLDVAASEGSEETEVNEDDAAKEQEAVERIKNFKRADREFQDLLEGDDDEVAKEFEARHQQRKLQEAQEQNVRRSNDAMKFSARLLPRDGDPKVFAVKVRPGFARKLVARIVNKCTAYLRGDNEAKEPQDLGIMSVFSVDHITEWIYIEAHRQLFVEKAISGLEHVFRFKITQVDSKELMQLLAPKPTRDRLEVGQYVRVKNGPYGGDIALVTEVREEGRTAVVQLVPREKFSGQIQRDKPIKHQKVPQQFFVPKLAIGARQLPNGDWAWSGLTFTRDGYLLQSYQANRLLFGSGFKLSSTDEIASYYPGNIDEIESALKSLAQPKGLPSFAFCRDDPVRVVSGQLTGVKGRVIHADNANNRATIATQVQGRQGTVTLAVPLDELRKHFDSGVHVVIDSGAQAGESGTVISCSGEEVIILADEGQRELHANVAECRVSAMKAQRPHSSGQNKLFDLVELSDDKGVGCIVAFSGTSVSVLTPSNVVMRTSLQHVKQTLRDRNVASDRLLNTVSVKDEVVVDDRGVPPRFSKLRASVQQVHGDILFATSPQLRENAGMFAICAKNVMRVGGQAKQQKSHAFAKLKTVAREPHPAQQAKVTEPVVVRGAISAMSARTVDREVNPYDW